MRERLHLFLTLSLVTAAGVAARADVVELKNGGKIHGEVTNAADQQATTYVIATDGGGRMTISRSAVVRVTAQTQDAKAGAAPDPQKKNDQRPTREELMAARGLIAYNGGYYTRQHIELLKQAQAAKKTDADWKNQLQRRRRWLSGRRKDRSDEALREIRQIKDPAAGPALVSLLDAEKHPEVKRLLIDVAAALGTSEVLEKLVQISLTDPDEELRYAALDHLVATGRPGLAGPYIRALKSNDNVIVNRAAEALGTIGNREAIGPLIRALVTKHKALVGGSPDQYVFTPSGGTAMSMGGNGPKLVSRDVENPAVLTALAKLAGTNFGFDQKAWTEWLTAQAKANPVDLRRDL